jgi:hypothetical protein
MPYPVNHNSIIPPIPGDSTEEQKAGNSLDAIFKERLSKHRMVLGTRGLFLDGSPTGTGKTAAGVMIGMERNTATLAPTYENIRQVVQEGAKWGIKVVPYPEVTSENCQKPEEVKEAQDRGLSFRHAVCAGCRFRNSCRYWKQVAAAKQAGKRVATQDRGGLRMSEVTKGVEALVIEEASTTLLAPHMEAMRGFAAVAALARVAIRHWPTKTCTGRDPSKLSGDFNECLLLCGRRSGKSKLIALVGAFEALFSGREAKLSAGEVGLVAVLSPTRNQSGIIHSYMRSVFDVPLLEREVVEDKSEGFKLRNGIEIRIETADPRHIRGFTLVSAITDETSMFGLSDDSRVRSDSELIRALRPALATTGGRLLCVATPYRAAGHCYRTFRDHHGNDEAAVLVWSGPSLLMNPTLPKSVVERALQEDPPAARSEYCIEPGAFREDVDTFITRAAVEALVIKGRKEVAPRSNLHRYAAFADVSGGRQDDAALAIAHLEGEMVVIDLLERYPSPHVPSQVVADISQALWTLHGQRRPVRGGVEQDRVRKARDQLPPCIKN